MLRFYVKIMLAIALSSGFACKTQVKTAAMASSEIPVPTQQSGEPNLYANGDHLYLSWIEHVDDSTRALVFSELKNGQWTTPNTIAKGTNWFVNWADFPSLVVQPDGKAMAAHWLQKSTQNTYDYDVHVAQSIDGGATWQPSFILHNDGLSAEHGFVSLETLSDGRYFATWLDGRKSKGEHGAMSLRSAIFDKKGNITDTLELDEKVCDCCQTAATRTQKGVVVAYRNRSEDEIRDIYVTREVKGQWMMPKPVHNDYWKIKGCPVNGPAIAANGNDVALVWYTSAEGMPQVKIAFSDDAGEHFGAPIRIDDGKPLGRVDVLFLSKTKVLVTWLEEKDKMAEIRAVTVSSNGMKSAEKLLMTTDASRKSGFPRIVKAGNTVVLAWTEVKDKKTIIKTKYVSVN